MRPDVWQGVDWSALPSGYNAKFHGYEYDKWDDTCAVGLKVCLYSIDGTTTDGKIMTLPFNFKDEYRKEPMKPKAQSAPATDTKVSIDKYHQYMFVLLLYM